MHIRGNRHCVVSCYNDKWNRCADSKSDGEGGTSNRFHRISCNWILSGKRGPETDCRPGRVSGGRTKDFSRQLELEESDAELERLQLTLNELLEDVREEGHFAENVVQEMWMPVSVILTRSAWCLGDWRLSQRQRWQIELVQKKAQILSDFIQEVSFFAKADQGCQPAYKKRMNISELTTGIIEGQISRLQEADEPVQIDYEIEPEIYAEVDENCYRKMLLNLLENSIDYSREIGLIKVVVESKGSEFTCKIADAGIGISETDLPHVWDRFFRGDPLGAGEGHFGLGLSVVKWIVDVHY